MKLLYRPLSLLFSVLGGLLAGQVFQRVWKAISGDSRAPSSTSPEHSTREVLMASALHGAIFALVQAAVSRAGAKGFKKATGFDPGK